jgi:hypothetical protein
MSLSSPADPNSILAGPYAASRSAWLAARAEASAAIEKIKTSISKTRDSRAVPVNAALDRILRRIPDAGCAFDALADAEDAGQDAAALKENARKTVQLASYYLRSDRLVAMVRENPFHPLSVDKVFSRALQNMLRELK